ncbi:hypothetical protein E3P99_02247 [Wallemia hederae]|uniref:CENP-T/Histone H4 histone fold domain-containing protein n=1 Tax=Wallemia hederae TaxID=1540922 RepID=A0A4T0FL04_9BASI|nr:hypothetical protein E3P99_02247 [Wallemia hederae]
MTTPNNKKRKNYPPIPTPNRVREPQPPTPSRRTPRGTRILPPGRTQQTPNASLASTSSVPNLDRETPRTLLRKLTKAPNVQKPSPVTQPPQQSHQQTPSARRQSDASTSRVLPDAAARSTTPQSNIPPTVRRSSAFKGVSKPSMPPPPSASSVSARDSSPASISSVDSPVSVGEYWQQHRPISRSPSAFSAFDETEIPEIARRERPPDQFRLSIANRSSMGGASLAAHDDTVLIDNGDIDIHEPSLRLDNTARRQSQAQSQAHNSFLGDGDKTVDVGNESSFIRQPPIQLDEVDDDDIVLDDDMQNYEQQGQDVDNQERISRKGSIALSDGSNRQARRTSNGSGSQRSSPVRGDSVNSRRSSLEQRESQTPQEDHQSEANQSLGSTHSNQDLANRSDASIGSRSSGGSKRPRESDESITLRDTDRSSPLQDRRPSNTEDRHSTVEPSDRGSREPSELPGEDGQPQEANSPSIAQDEQELDELEQPEEEQEVDELVQSEQAPEEDVPFEDEIPADGPTVDEARENESDRGRDSQASSPRASEQPENEQVEGEEPLEELADMLPMNDMVDMEVAEGDPEEGDVNAWEDDENTMRAGDLTEDGWNLPEEGEGSGNPGNPGSPGNPGNPGKAANVADDSMAIRPRSNSADDPEEEEEATVLDTILKQQGASNGDDPDATIGPSSVKRPFKAPIAVPRSVKARTDAGVKTRVPTITPSLLKKHLERFMNQNRSGPKLSLDKGVEGVLMDRAMEYLDVLLDGADSVSRTSRISEKDVIQVMQMHGFISDKQPIPTVARRMLSTEMSYNYDKWSMEWSGLAKKGGAKKKGRKPRQSQREEEEEEEAGEEAEEDN